MRLEFRVLRPRHEVAMVADRTICTKKYGRESYDADSISAKSGISWTIAGHKDHVEAAEKL